MPFEYFNHFHHRRWFKSLQIEKLQQQQKLWEKQANVSLYDQI